MQLDLERLYEDDEPRVQERESVAPFVLHVLDRRLREETRGTRSLDTIVRAFASSGEGSFYRQLEASPSWPDFRRRHVQGREHLPNLEPATFAPTRPVPARRKAATRSVTLVYTGATEGYLENCGCKTDEAGGLARRVTLLRQLRSSHPRVVVLDAGSTFPRAEHQTTLDRFALDTASTSRVSI